MTGCELWKLLIRRSSERSVDTDSLLKRVPFVWRIRNVLRGTLFDFLRHIAMTDDSRDIFSKLLQDQNAHCFPCDLPSVRTVDAPYPDLGWVRRDRTASRGDILFITGR